MDDINTEYNMKSICRPAMAQWTERLTRKGKTRVQNWKGANILLSHNPANIGAFTKHQGTVYLPAYAWITHAKCLFS